jgi:hypothetical protein
MFEVGDTVVLDCVSGVIVGWHFDEGNVWTVRLADGSMVEMADDLSTVASWMSN